MAEEKEQQDETERVNNYIKAQMDNYWDELEAKKTKAKPTQQTQVTSEDEGRKQLKELIDPIYGQEVSGAKFTAQDAKDYVTFYRKYPNAGEFEEEIEKTFTALAEAGRPFSRETVYQNVLGREYSKDPEKFVTKHNEVKERKVKEAQTASDMGQFGVGSTRSDNPFKDFDKLSLADMEKALDGVTF